MLQLIHCFFKQLLISRDMTSNNCPVCQTEYTENQGAHCSSCGWNLATTLPVQIPTELSQKHLVQQGWAKNLWLKARNQFNIEAFKQSLESSQSLSFPELIKQERLGSSAICPVCQTEYIPTQISQCGTCEWDLTPYPLILGQIPDAFIQKEQAHLHWAKQLWRLYQQQSPLRKELANCKELGDIFYNTDQYNLALERYQRALEIAEQLGDVEQVADVLCNLGNLARVSNRYSDSIELLQRAYQIYNQIGNRLGQANALDYLGYTYYFQSE